MKVVIGTQAIATREQALATVIMKESSGAADFSQGATQPGNRLARRYIAKRAQRNRIRFPTLVNENL